MSTKTGKPAKKRSLAKLPARKRTVAAVEVEISSGEGAVQFFSYRKAPNFSTGDLIAAAEAGLPVGEVEALRGNLEVSLERLLEVLGIARATFHRRKTEGRLRSDESDRVLRFARLFGKAVQALETVENTRAWLMAPQRGLGGSVPFNYAATELGARAVEDLLGRIEHGVYS